MYWKKQQQFLWEHLELSIPFFQFVFVTVQYQTEIMEIVKMQKRHKFD